MIWIVLRALSVVVSLLTVASLAFPPLGQFVADIIVGLWRRTSPVLRWVLGTLLGIVIAATMVFCISGLVTLAGFA